MKQIDDLEAKYNSEYDMIPGGPDFNWVDIKLLDLIRQLHERIAVLERPIAAASTPSVRAGEGP